MLFKVIVYVESLGSNYEPVTTVCTVNCTLLYILGIIQIANI